MSKVFEIGVIGQGFVGSAIFEGLKNFYTIRTFDIDKSKCNSTHEDVCLKSDIIFVCIPTPMRASGECDTRLLESVIQKIDKKCLDKNSPILVIKSTIPPGTTKRISESCAPNLDVCFSPEFLTEANSFEDFKNQTRIIIGGPRPATGKIKQMFRRAFPETPIIKTGSNTAETVKYFTNCFLATKVIFANEMYDICNAAGVDFDKVAEYSLHDKRIGKSHLMVPGPDGDRGFGGHCFPKDMEAMIYFAEENNIDPELLKRVLSKNDKLRKNRDWESMKGRAVSDD
jgi:nucleotide sugar dehydrogenase